jgi:hypothetical protein
MVACRSEEGAAATGVAWAEAAAGSMKAAQIVLWFDVYAGSPEPVPTRTYIVNEPRLVNTSALLPTPIVLDAEVPVGATVTPVP